MFDRVDVLIVMNEASLQGFEDRLYPGGLLVMDSSNIKSRKGRDDIWHRGLQCHIAWRIYR